MKTAGSKSRRNLKLLRAGDQQAKETRYLELIPGMKKSILRGLKTTLDRCSRWLRWGDSADQRRPRSRYKARRER